MSLYIFYVLFNVRNKNPLYGNSISVSEYWHKYPALKLSSISHSSALILVHIIKNNFNSAYCPDSTVTGES